MSNFWFVTQQAEEILRLRAENRLLEIVILDMAGELGVKPDNEEIIAAIERLRAENEKLRAACKAGIRMVAAFEDALEEAGVVIRETGDSAAAAALKETE